MKERVLTLALAVVAFALFYTLTLPKVSGPQDHPTRPVSIEKGPNGYLAMMRWLQAEDANPVSLRERYGRLDALTDPQSRTGNLLITTTPHLYPLRSSEVIALRRWIAAGNTMLVLAGLADTPDWSMGEGIDPAFMVHMNQMTGLDFSEPPARDAAAATADPAEGNAVPQSAEQPAQAQQNPASARRALVAPGKFAQAKQFEMAPNGPHPLLEGVESVQALSEYPAGQWRASSATVDVILELAQNRDSGEPVLWLLRHGEGQIIVSAYGSLFTNKLLGVQDNARLLANIVKWSRAIRGQVIIDDAHQGLVAFYDPQAFFGDARLHASLWWLVVLWLVFVLGPQRLRVAGSTWNPVDITSFVRASGGFLARALKPATVGQRLFENFFNDIRRHTGLPANGAPVWDWMLTRGVAADHEIEQLQQLHGKVLREQRIDLSKLQNLLVQLRRKLL